MSDISLNANVYQVSKRYYDIINQFLNQVKTDRQPLSETDKKPVQELFIGLSNPESHEPQIHMLAVIVDRALRGRNKRFREVAKKITEDLKSDELISDDAIAVLEDISRALDNERVRALTRMKGTRG